VAFCSKLVFFHCHLGNLKLRRRFFRPGWCSKLLWLAPSCWQSQATHQQDRGEKKTNTGPCTHGLIMSRGIFGIWIKHVCSQNEWWIRAFEWHVGWSVFRFFDPDHTEVYTDIAKNAMMLKSFDTYQELHWLVVSTHPKNLNQFGASSKIRRKVEYILICCVFGKLS
jgi:hypothetical protein